MSWKARWIIEKFRTKQQEEKYYVINGQNDAHDDGKSIPEYVIGRKKANDGNYDG